MTAPLVVAIEMGYGHLRAARPLAHALSTRVLEADRAPLAGDTEQRLWARTRRWYEGLTRLSTMPGVGAPLRTLVDSITFIEHLHPYRDLSAPTRGVRVLQKTAGRGLGRGLIARMRDTREPLLTTFFAPAVIADAAGCENIYCVVTDSDINRVWAPFVPAATRIEYLVPSTRAARRLRAYGVPEERITLTGFPLPQLLVDDCARNLAARIVRLDPRGKFRAAVGGELERELGTLPRDREGQPPHVMFAVGGAGAQVSIARQFLRGMALALRTRKIRLTLVAGVRREIAQAFERELSHLGLEEHVEIFFARDHESYFQGFDARLAETDVLWTKPSELTFYGALGLALVLSPPVGVHEDYNRRWALTHGAGLQQADPRFAAEWLTEWLDDGALAGAAWSGYRFLPREGTRNILRHLDRV